MPKRGLGFSSGLVIVLLIGLAVQTGCQQTQKPVEEARPSQLAIFYGRFIRENKGKSPANEKELKEFIRKADSNVNVDDIFVSPRDREPYVVQYKSGSNMLGPDAITVHEKTGVDGKRMVGFATGQVRIVDDAEFQKLMSGAP